MLLPDFTKCRALVLGDLMLDRYWHGGTHRISPEAPVPVVKVSHIEDRAGGAGNVAINLASLGAAVSLIGHCGTDDPGIRLGQLLKDVGVELDLWQHPGLPTITKLRVLSRHQQLIRLDFEESFGELDPAPLSERFGRLLPECRVAILSDYGKGTLSDPRIFIRQARAAGVPVLIDPKGKCFDHYRGATLITPNRSEFEAIAGHCPTHDELIRRGMAMLESLELEALLITRGEQGMTLLQRHQPPLDLPAQAREVYDVTGAGDTVIAILAAGLGSGLTLADATRIANTGAGIAVGKLGTASVSAAELAQALHAQRAPARGVIGLDELLPLLATLRQNGEKVVVTNGCFDILHPGHADYLQRARGLGDRLIVLVNSDDSVRRLKGPERPVNPLGHRMALLAALECVDWVLPFEEDTPASAIERIIPDILVKGGDYASIEQIAGHETVLAHGGEVRLLDFVDGFSTTGLIEKIIRQAPGGGPQG